MIHNSVLDYSVEMVMLKELKARRLRGGERSWKKLTRIWLDARAWDP